MNADKLIQIDVYYETFIKNLSAATGFPFPKGPPSRMYTVGSLLVWPWRASEVATQKMCVVALDPLWRSPSRQRPNWGCGDDVGSVRSIQLRFEAVALRQSHCCVGLAP
jgi:hypothetical protein